jgi:hypothetical protein
MNLDSFPHPLRLAEGAYREGTGAGCGMNVISYENGDTEITDMPQCSAAILSRLVQHINDFMCYHQEAVVLDDDRRVRYLCPTCASTVLDLAHKTVGTARIDPKTGQSLAGIWPAPAEWLYAALHDKEFGIVQRIPRCDQSRYAVTIIDKTLEGNATQHDYNDLSYALHVLKPKSDDCSVLYSIAKAFYLLPEPGGYEPLFPIGVPMAMGYARTHVEKQTDIEAIVACKVKYAHWAIDTWHQVRGTSPVAPEPVKVAKAMKALASR